MFEFVVSKIFIPISKLFLYYGPVTLSFKKQYLNFQKFDLPKLSTAQSKKRGDFIKPCAQGVITKFFSKKYFMLLGNSTGYWNLLQN